MKAIVLGASGLIGGELIRLLSADPDLESIRIVTRRPLNVHLPKLEERVIDLNNNEQVEGGRGQRSMGIFLCRNHAKTGQRRPGRLPEDRSCHHSEGRARPA